MVLVVIQTFMLIVASLSIQGISLFLKCLLFSAITKITQKLIHFCSFQSFSETSDQLHDLIYITSCLESHILLILKKMRALSS